MKTFLCTLVGVVLGISFSLRAFAAYPDVAPPAGSRLQQVATITNTRDAATAVLSVIFSPNNDVLGIYSVFYMNDEQGTVTRDVLTLDQIQRPEGAVLHSENGMDVFILQGSLDPVHGVAALQIRYLTNALKHAYGSCRINGARLPQGDWRLINAYNGAIVSEARARIWAFGVRTIDNVCPPVANEF